jgi:hypothetical protein
MAFDENRYKALFEKRFGTGLFEAGFSRARNIGTSTAQVRTKLLRIVKVYEIPPYFLINSLMISVKINRSV